MKYFLLSIVFGLTSRLMSQEYKVVISPSKEIAQERLFINYKTAEGLWVKDSATLNHGKFTFHGKINHPVKAALILDKNKGLSYKNYCYFYLEPAQINLFLDVENPLNSQFSGSELQKEFTAYQRNENTEFSVLNYLTEIKKSLYEKELSSIGIEKDSINDLRVQLHNLIRDKSRQMHVDYDMKFAFNHPNSILSLDLLNRLSMNVSAFNQLEGINAIYKHLNKNLTESPKGKTLKKRLEELLSKTSVGVTGKDFIVKNIVGETIQLSQYRNKKYVLLHFWATWCGSCIEEFPRLKRIIESNQENVELLNIAVLSDKDINKIKKSIKKHALIGENISSFQNKNSWDLDIIEEKYPIDILPLKILIDKNGRIIKRWFGSNDNDLYELEYTLSNFSK